MELAFDIVGKLTITEMVARKLEFIRKITAKVSSNMF